MNKDMIDFPVSDAWRDHYYDCGLTPYRSPGYRSRESRELDSLCRELERLSRTLGDVLQYLQYSQTAVAEQAAARPARQAVGQSRKGRKTWPLDTR